MGSIISIKDGSTQVMMGLPDFEHLVKKHIGFEAWEWFEAYLHDTYGEEEEVEEIIREHEEEMEKVHTHYQEILRKLREESEILAGLICEKDLDRQSISRHAGNIGRITGRAI